MPEHYFSSVDAEEKRAFVLNTMSAIDHHNGNLRIFSLNIANILALIHWGAIVALAAFVAATMEHSPKIASNRIFLVFSFILFTAGIIFAILMKIFIALFSLRMARYYRKYLKDAIWDHKEIRWFEERPTDHPSVYTSIIFCAFSMTSLIIGMAFALYVVISVV